MVTSTKSSDLLVCVFLVRIRFILLGRVFQGFGVCVCVYVFGGFEGFRFYIQFCRCSRV